MITVKGNFKKPYESCGYHNPGNPQVEITVSKCVNVKMTLETPLGSNSCAIVIFLTKPTRKVGRSSLPKKEVIEKSSYLRSNKVAMESNLLPGRYIVVLCLEKPGLSGGFSFSVSKSVDDVRILPDYIRRSVKGSWSKLNGGYKSPKNPQYTLDVQKRTHVVIRLIDKNKRNSLYFFVTKASRRKGTRRKVIRDSEITGQSRYLISHEVSVELDLVPDQERPFLIIPCSGKAACPFTLIVESDVPSSLGELREVIEVKHEIKECNCDDILQRHRDFENPPFMKTNPIFDIISHCRAHGCKFRDDEFPCSEVSLNKNDGRNVEKVHGVGSWKRPGDFLESPDLYCDGIEIQDMRQGGLPDCWLCQGLATCCMREERITSLISPSGYSSHGVYVIKMYHEDSWKYIVIDDYIPVGSSDEYLFARSQDPNELYVPLMEKAFAKSFGSFRSLTRRSIGTALTKLTGGETNIRFHDKVGPDALWKEMMEYDRQKWLMGASSKDSDRDGIKGQHAYSIMSVHEIGTARLLKIRNTWGQFEWNGPWCDSDEKRWTPEIKRKLRFENKDDGIFYMAVEDYHRHYSSTTLCKIVNDLYPFSYKYRGDWRDEDNGWSEPYPLQSSGRKIPITIKHPNTTIHCTLVRTSNDVKEGDNSILLYCVKGKIKTAHIPQESILVQSRFMVAMKTKFEKKVKDVGTYHLMPTSTNRNEEYTVIIHTDKEIEFGGEWKNPYPYSQTLAGNWNPCTGYLRCNNPQFCLSLEEQGTTEIIIDLKRMDKKRMLGMLIVVCKPGTDLKRSGRHPQVQKNEIVAESRYLMANEISLAVALENNQNRPYYVVICLQSKFAGIKYRMEVKSDKRFSFKNC